MISSQIAHSKQGRGTASSANYRYFLLLFPVAIIALDLVFFLLDDFLDEGFSIFYLDVYNQGYFTWWLDFERFWGNFETWSVLGSWTGLFAFFTFGAAPETMRVEKARLVKIPLILLAGLLVIAVVFSASSTLAPVPYSFLSIIAFSWYPTYFPGQVLFFLLACSGFWLLFPRLSKLSNERITTPVTTRMAAVLLVISMCVLHLVMVSTWNAESLGALLYSLPGVFGFLFVTVPLFSFMVASIECKLHRSGDVVLGKRTAEDGRVVGRRNKYALGILLIITAFLIFMLIGLYFTSNLDIGIEIRSDFVPRNMLSWASSALVATITFFSLQGRSKES
nr:hypothetical protein [Candidatus Sigynarchaeota archaeon]